MGVFGLIQSPTPVRSLHTEVIAQKAYKAQEVKEGVAWASLAVPDGGGVLEAEREKGDRDMVLWRYSRHGARSGQGELRVLQM
jgi:hypothetical protein